MFLNANFKVKVKTEGQKYFGEKPYRLVIKQGPVVRKSINADPRLKVKRGFHLARLKWV